MTKRGARHFPVHVCSTERQRIAGVQSQRGQSIFLISRGRGGLINLAVWLKDWGARSHGRSSVHRHFFTLRSGCRKTLTEWLTKKTKAKPAAPALLPANGDSAARCPRHTAFAG